MNVSFLLCCVFFLNFIWRGGNCRGLASLCALIACITFSHRGKVLTFLIYLWQLHIKSFHISQIIPSEQIRREHSQLAWQRYSLIHHLTGLCHEWFLTLKLSLFPLEKLRVLHAQVLILKLEVFKKLFNALSLCLLLLVSQHQHFVLIFKTIHFLS
jgi:hypothetical protein